MEKYPIAKSDKQPIPSTPESRAKSRYKWYRKNKTKLNRRQRNHYWEKLRLPPEQWTRYDIPQDTELCLQCRMYKPICQFVFGICVQCRKPNLPPIDNTHLTYPK